MGLYKPMSEETTPRLAQIHPSFRSEYLAGKCHTPYGLCVNTKRIAMTEDKPKRKRGRPLEGEAPMSLAESQRRRPLRLIEAARLGTLVRIYADRMAYRLDMAEGQIQELRSAL